MTDSAGECLSLRFADSATAEHYPLAVSAECEWQRKGETWSAHIPLSDLAAGSILAPSLSVLSDEPYGFQFTLMSNETASWPLPDVPRQQSSPAVSDRRVRTALDCFHLLKPLRAASLQVTCHCAQQPTRYLLVVSMRPVDMPSVAAPAVEVRCHRAPPGHSQMLENPRIASRICSPISTGMVIGHHGHSVDWHSLLRDCYDPVTKMYGMWPLAIRAASHYGCLGAVELFSGWQEVGACLAADIPLVASIRFGNGLLPGAPLGASGGHLIVVHGLNSTSALVNDPAASNHGSVARSYSTQALAEAWFRHRGAAYILLP